MNTARDYSILIFELAYLVFVGTLLGLLIGALLS